MKSGKLRSTCTMILAMLTSGIASAQIPDGYYDSLKGKKGAELKTAVYNIIKDPNVLNYGSGNNSTWWGYYVTDKTDDGYCIDRYTPKDEWNKFGSQGNVIGGMNIEHSFPQSWWGGSNCTLKKDLYNIMPCESKINSAKSNYGMGEVTDVKKTNGATKIGTGNGMQLWEPADEWKGDFARGFMYIVTAYQDYQNKWTSEGTKTLYNNTYPTLKEWASKLYLKWARQDRPDDLEIKRNEAVSQIQGNRNPYVDFPNLMEYVWGDSVDYTFDPTTTLKATDYKGGNPDTPDTPDTPEDGTLYTADYKSFDGNCTIKNVTLPEGGTYVWTRTSNYGWKGSAYISKQNKAADAYLILPEMDLTAYTSATLNFTQALNFCKEPESYMSVEVICEGDTTKLDGINWPAGSSWTFYPSGDIDLSRYAGKKIQIAFHYTSDTTTAGTWEISTATVMGKKTADCIPTIVFDVTRPYEIYNLNGHKLSDTRKAKGMIIIRQNGNSWKKIMR